MNFDTIRPFLNNYDDFHRYTFTSNTKCRPKGDDSFFRVELKKIPLHLPLKEGFKLLRKKIFWECVKGGSEKVRSVEWHLINSHEELARKGKEPSVAEVFDSTKKKLQNGMRFYIKGGTVLDDLVLAEFSKLPASTRPTREWLTNFQIDEFFKTQEFRGVILKTNLAGGVKSFIDYLNSNEDDYLPVGIILNTAMYPPGEHWVSLFAMPKYKKIFYYDSCLTAYCQSIYEPLLEFAKENGYELISPYLFSQFSDTECGLYAVAAVRVAAQGDPFHFICNIVPDLVLSPLRVVLENGRAR